MEILEPIHYFDLADCEDMELGAVVTISSGCQYPQFEWPEEDLQPFSLIEKLIGDSIILSDPKYMRVSEREKRKFGFHSGDIILTHNSSSGQLGKCTLFDLPDFVLHTKYLRLVTNEHMNSQFLLLMLNNLRLEGSFHSIAKQKGNVFYMLIDDLKRLKIPVPTIEDQKQLLDFHFRA
ncbi:restriction endonuclease subunit S [Dyadobacter sp. CY347]|uniref:restriction endonuclease subunit S n=1 Tax=Dyadobacter sp. CY347 TaxID=2909336 RepID=UPI001F4850B8|nr:restriction endonuclease subunit S [Dyadobacter sp. CY347]MCF2488620.1 restriction endonuclease subunit S [Dyadobacter sp. CY347]